jgi:hypothetical protein
MFTTIDNERRKGEVKKISQQTAKKGIKIGSSEMDRYKGSSKDSKQYNQIKKAGENITEKMFPGKNNTLINEKRKVEVFKLDNSKTQQDLRLSSKETGRYTETSKESKQYSDISKKGEKITEKIYPGKDNTLINEKRTVEVFKLDKSKSRKDMSLDSRERGRNLEGKKYLDQIENLRKKGEQITDKIYPGKDKTLIKEQRKVEVYKTKGGQTIEEIDKLTKGGKRYPGSLDKSKEYIGIEKQGENITEKIYRGKDNKLILEKRKVEVFRRSKSKEKFPIDEREAKRYTDTMKEYEKYGETVKEPGRYTTDYKESKQYLELQREKGLIREPRKRRQIKKFVEKDGITKKFIREKMAEIWDEENKTTASQGITLFGYGAKTNKTFIYGNRGISSDKRAVATETNEINRLNRLINEIKSKDIELNKVVSQLRTHLAGKSKTYDTHISGKASVNDAKKLIKLVV